MTVKISPLAKYNGQYYSDLNGKNPSVGTGAQTPGFPSNLPTIQLSAKEKIPPGFKGTVGYHYTPQDNPPPESTADVQIKKVLYLAPKEDIPKPFKGTIVYNLQPNDAKPQPRANKDIDFHAIRWGGANGPVQEKVDVQNPPTLGPELSPIPTKDILDTFNRLDGNHDGQLTRKEAGNDPLLGGGNFKQLDVNKDRVLTLPELTPLGKAFTTADKNGDGKLVSCEIANSLFKDMMSGLQPEMKDESLSFDELYQYVQPNANE